MGNFAAGVMMSVLCAGLFVLAFAGCKAGGTGPITWDNGASNPTSGPADNPEALPQGVDFTDGFSPCDPLEKVYFDYNSAALNSAGVAALADDAAYIKQNPNMYRIEGHCDERGTQEYNLALGEKRALAVRTHLVKLGVPGNSLITSSYGKEYPADPGHNEQAWQKNRRCEFSAKARK